MGRPLWVQALDSLPLGSQGRGLGSPGVGLWGRGWQGGEDKGRAPENTVPPAWRPLVAHNRASFTCVRVCVCVSNARVCVKHHKPRGEGGREGEGKRSREMPHTCSEGTAVPLSAHTRRKHVPQWKQQQMQQGQRSRTRHPREEEDRREHARGETICNTFALDSTSPACVKEITDSH